MDWDFYRAVFWWETHVREIIVSKNSFDMVPCFGSWLNSFRRHFTTAVIVFLCVILICVDKLNFDIHLCKWQQQ